MTDEDGNKSSPAKLEYTIESVNDLPKITAIGGQQAIGGGTRLVLGADGNIKDLDSDTGDNRSGKITVTDVEDDADANANVTLSVGGEHGSRFQNRQRHTAI